MKPTLTTSSEDSTAKLKRALAQLQKKQVYVGIPENKTDRREGAITNAALLQLHTLGSPLQGIPARPVLEPALSDSANRELITTELGEAARSLLDGDAARTRQHLKRAGQLGANAAKRYVLQEDHLAPNAPSTVKEKGSDRPLVDTNQMVRAVTYVVEDQD